jgi:acetyl esterase/lipase
MERVQKRLARAPRLGLGLGLGLLSVACGAPVEHHDVVYDARFGDATAMDVFLPAGSGTARPAVLFVHGGSWSGGGRGDFTAAAARLARSGYVTATIDYRLVPDGAFPGDVQDVACALAFFEAHATDYGLDPARVAIMGYSAGGQLVSLYGLDPGEPSFVPACAAGAPRHPPRAVIDGAGPTDLRAIEGPAVRAYLGGSSDAVPTVYDLASPLTHAHAGGKPPFLIIQGGGDWIVPEHASFALRDALTAAGNQAEFLAIGGGGHLLNPTPDGDLELAVSTDAPEAWLAIDDFLARTVGRP